jgi:serine/threonine protein kinase
MSDAPQTGHAKPSSEAATRAPTRPASSDTPTLPPEPAKAAAGTAAPSGWSDGLPTQLPAMLGRYRLLNLLGKGGMGAVYLAHDTQLDRRVAVKIPTVAPGDAAALQRFFREAQAAATLAHPSLCPVYDAGQIDGVYYLTMAYIEGKPLATFIRPGQQLPERTVAAVVRQLALAMQAAHDKGVIHRDLKPANIMITPTKRPVIMDFGLARRIVGAGEVRLTQSGAILGTPAYMPPEQVNGDLKAMGPCCDIYSLGVILYELLTGRLPFEGPLGALIAQIVLDAPPPPSRFRSALDSRLEAICLKALAKEPANRFASMKEFAAALAAYLRDPNPAPAGRPVAVEGYRLQEDDTAARVFEEMAGHQPTLEVPPERPHRSHHANRRTRSSWSARLEAAADRLFGHPTGAKVRRLFVTLCFIAFASCVSYTVYQDTYGSVTVRLRDPVAYGKVQLTIDGEVHQLSPLTGRIRLRPGSHEVRVEGPEYEPFSATLTVRARRNEGILVKLTPRPSPSPAPAGGGRGDPP